MTVAVWKFKLETDGLINMPAGAKILTVHEQHGGIFLWALVDLDGRESNVRRFKVLGTGHHDNDQRPSGYIGTVFLGGLVFHVFEIMP